MLDYAAHLIYGQTPSDHVTTFAACSRVALVYKLCLIDDHL